MMTRSEKINLGATIAGPIVLALLGSLGLWIINARFSMERSAADKYNAETYVPKAWFKEAHDETNHKLDVIVTWQGTMDGRVSRIEGELTIGQQRMKAHD